MTYYFDNKQRELSMIRVDEMTNGAAAKALEAIDEAVVWDVSIASELPGFPPHLIDAVGKCILEHSSACQPIGAEGPNYETPDAHRRGIGTLIDRLHTVFHDVTQAAVVGFTDDPRAPLRFLNDAARTRRAALLDRKVSQ